MVDPEKLEQNTTPDSDPAQPTEGGEKASGPASTAAVGTVQPVDPFAEPKAYSDEDYARFVELYDRTLNQISEGQIVTGRVLAITEREIFVDIGFKSEGTVPLEEFPDPTAVKVGDKIEVFLDTIEDTDGQLILSKKKANFMRLWDNVVEIEEKGGTIEGRCVRWIKGGIVVDLMGVDAFLPGSQIDVKPVRDFDALIGQMFTFKIVKVNKLRKNIVVSRRALLEESMAETRGKILSGLERGQVYAGTVKNITDFGVFVDLGGVDGLLHINDLSWGRVNHPSEVVKLDEKIKVVVLEFNDAKDRISLGMKQLQPHPWQGIEEKFPEGTVVRGRVVSIADYGAFVELQKGVEGLVHVSEMTWTRHTIHPSKIVNVGDEIDVKVLSVDKERKRISLGIKQLTPDPWENIETKYPVGVKYKGRVRNMTTFGAFVEMEEGIDGLIHISDLSWTKKVKHPSEILKKGEEIDVVVLGVNKEERRVSLGYKQLSDDPWPTFEESYKVGTITTSKVVRFVDKGMIVELPLGLEGFVPLSQTEEGSMPKLTQTVKVGDDIRLAVLEFDRDNKRVVLSRKKAVELEKDGASDEDRKNVDEYIGKPESGPTLGEMTEKTGKEDEPKKKGRKKEGKPSEAEEAKAEASDAAKEEDSKETEPPSESPPSSGSGEEDAAPKE
jgi:small subunit ribosomal protein S1